MTTPTCILSLRRWFVRLVLVLILFVLVGAALFVVNGMLLGHGETPYLETTSHPAGDLLSMRTPLTLKMMAFNIAKCFAPKGGLRFEHRDVVARRVSDMANILRAEQPDVVFLSETLLECTPCPINQIASLAEESGMHAWAFGENYNFGLPFYRAIGGNAILARYPLEGVANPSLSGRKPFYVTKNNRRVLWCAMMVGKHRVLLASVHNDSYSHDNSSVQVRQMLDYSDGQPAIIAGDFNAQPGDPPVELLRETGRFTGVVDGPPSFPADAPTKRIDLIFVPTTWELVDYRVNETEVSDHRPVVATFRVKW